MIPEGGFKHGIARRPDIVFSSGFFGFASRPGEGEKHPVGRDAVLAEFMEYQDARLEVVEGSGRGLDDEVRLLGKLDGGGAGSSGRVHNKHVQGWAHVEAGFEGLLDGVVAFHRRQHSPAVVDAALVPFKGSLLLGVEVGQSDAVAVA